MKRLLPLIFFICVVIIVMLSVAAADTEIVLIEKEINDNHIIIKRENGERLLLEKWSLRFSPLLFAGKSFAASISPMWVTIYFEDRDEIKWTIKERLGATPPQRQPAPGATGQRKKDVPAQGLNPNFILLVQGALSLLGLEPGPLVLLR
jgi:hypothetical protein